MRLRLLALGLCAYVIALIATAPATLLDASVNRASEGRLRVADAAGSFWAGRGELEMLDPESRASVSRPLAWRFLPGELLRGRLAWDASLGDAARPFRATASITGVRIEHADVALPAAALGFLVPKLRALELTGDLALHVATLSIGRARMEGGAELQWLGAGSVLSPVSPLGDYALDLRAEGTRIRIALRTLRGPIRLEGSGAWAIGERPVFDGVAQVPAEDEPRLAPLLRLIAVERAPGTFALQLR